MDSYRALKAKLDRGETVIIDGGTGTELERLGVEMVDGAWCGAGGISAPGVLQDVHEKYIRAGAEVIIANTFASGRHICEQGGFGDKFESANRTSVAAALAAREANRGDGANAVVVAGSVSVTHQGGTLPSLDVSAQDNADQAAILADAGCDMIISEMLRDVDRTNTLLNAVRPVGLPIWVGFSVVERDGETWLWDETGPFDDALPQIDLAGVDVVSIMHSEVEHVDGALDVLAKHWNGPVGVYAQSGEFIPPNWQFIDTITPYDYTAAAQRWAGRGVQVLGGCCGIGPEHISHLAAHHR